MDATKNTVLFIPDEVMQDGKTEHFSTPNKVGFRTPFGKLFTALKKYRSGKATNPIAPNQADIVNWVLYDTVSVAANATFASAYTFFNQPIGTNSKTKIDTNMEQVMRLPDPQAFNCTHMGFGFNPNIGLADLKSILLSYYCEFWIGQKNYAEGPLVKFPAGTGISGYAATTATTTTIDAANNGFPSAANSYDLRLPQGMQLGNMVTDGLMGLYINQGLQFQVKIAGTSFTTANNSIGVKVICFLDGILSRAVQ